MIENYVRLALNDKGIKARYGSKPTYPESADANPEGLTILHGYWTLYVDVSIRWTAGVGPLADQQLNITGVGPTPPVIIAPPISIPSSSSD